MVARRLLLASTVVYVVVIVVLLVEGAWLLAGILAAFELAVLGYTFFRHPAADRLLFWLETARFARTGRVRAWQRRPPRAEPKLRDREESP